MPLGVLYSFQHAVSLLLLSDGHNAKALKSLFALVSMLSLCLIYAVKPDTYDIINYTKAVDYPYFEPLFSSLLILLRQFLPNRLVIAVVQLLILCFTFLTVTIYTKWETITSFDRVVLYLLALSSLSFTLGINNALRQYWASLILMISFMSLIRKRWLLSLILLLVSAGFHYSSALFYIVIFTVFLLTYFTYLSPIKCAPNVKFYFSKRLMISLMVILSLIAVLLLKPLAEFLGYTRYLSLNISEGRVDFSIKFVLTLIVFLISEHFFGPWDKEKREFAILRILRTFLIIIMLLLSLFDQYNELASRILFFYYSVEMLVIAKGYALGFRTGTILINLSYAFAVNAYNVLGKL